MDQVVDFLTADGGDSRDKHARAGAAQLDAGGIVDGLDGEDDTQRGVVLVEDGFHIRPELRIDAPAGAEDHDSRTPLGSRPIRADVPRGSNAVDQTEGPLNDGKRGDDVENEHHSYAKESFSLREKVARRAG